MLTKSAADDPEGIAVDLEVIEQPLVAHADQLAALHFLTTLYSLIAHDIAEQSLGKDQRFVRFDVDVVDVIG